MTTRTIETTEVAKLVRKALKDAFPNHRFSVRSDKYSGGSSIDVSWVDGPRESAVEEVISHFKGATFDGMQDLKEYHTSQHEGETVRFGNDFIFCKREASEATAKAMQEAVATAAGTEYDACTYVAVSVRDGVAFACKGAGEYMPQLARQLFGQTEFAHTKEKLQRTYF